MFIFLDTETTGNGPDDRLCQITFKPENGPTVSGLFNPGKPISIDAMAINHITEKMVADKPPFKESDEYKIARKLVSRKIDRLGPETALLQVVDRRHQLMEQIKILMSLEDSGIKHPHLDF